MFGDKKIKIKDSERSLISETVSIEGTINSSGAIDVAGLVKGPVYSKELIVRDTGSITGSIEADGELSSCSGGMASASACSSNAPAQGSASLLSSSNILTIELIIVKNISQLYNLFILIGIININY